MGYTLDQIKAILHDIKSSWYFRIWATVWIGFSIVAFACFLVLVGISLRAGQEDDVRVWFVEAPSITYPRFHFRCSSMENIESVVCSQNNLTVTTTYCQEVNGVLPDILHCVAVNANNFQVVNEHDDFERHHQRIECVVTTNGSMDGNTLIAWEIEGNNVGVFGDNLYAGIWIAPNDRAWVLLEQGILEQTNQQSPQVSWRRELLYHSTVSNIGTYNVATMIPSFHVLHLIASDSYDGWNALGDIGGFAFFMMMMHSFVLILVGLCFVNNSEWLHHKANPAAEMREKSALLH